MELENSDNKNDFAWSSTLHASHSLFTKQHYRSSKARSGIYQVSTIILLKNDEMDRRLVGEAESWISTSDDFFRFLVEAPIVALAPVRADGVEQQPVSWVWFCHSLLVRRVMIFSHSSTDWEVTET